jgi:hypothetical protein
MRGTKKGIVLALFLAAVPLGGAAAEPSYLIYPTAPAVFRFDPGRYEVLTAGHPRFDSGYAVENQMLWDRLEARIPVEVYRAPQLTGFEPSANGASEFVTYSNSFEVVIDGFDRGPHTVGNLCLRFWPEPAYAAVTLQVGGFPTNRFILPLPSFEVVTPIAGGFYSDTRSQTVSWVGATALRIIAFSDKDGNGAFDGTPLFGIVARDATVPVAPTTWGRVKALYR